MGMHERSVLCSSRVDLGSDRTKSMARGQGHECLADRSAPLARQRLAVGFRWQLVEDQLQCGHVESQRNYTVIPLHFVRAPEIASPLEVDSVGDEKHNTIMAFRFFFFFLRVCSVFLLIGAQISRTPSFFFFFQRWTLARVGNYLAALLVLA